MRPLPSPGGQAPLKIAPAWEKETLMNGAFGLYLTNVPAAHRQRRSVGGQSRVQDRGGMAVEVEEVVEKPSKRERELGRELWRTERKRQKRKREKRKREKRKNKRAITPPKSAQFTHAKHLNSR